jgi:hypothetical protein
MELSNYLKNHFLIVSKHIPTHIASANLKNVRGASRRIMIIENKIINNDLFLYTFWIISMHGIRVQCVVTYHL